jgi:hypothetical protein
MLQTNGKSHLLRGGHAPGFLRDIVCEALASYSPDSWVEALDDELGEENIEGQHLLHWLSMTKTQRAFWLTANLWHCTDIMPSHICGEADLPCGSTYACAARELRTTIPDGGGEGANS